jgi:hypothetical protein
VTELLLCDNVYHTFQTIRCTFTVSNGWKANEMVFPPKFCRLICWLALWLCGLEGVILTDRDMKCFCLYFLTLTV